MYTIGQVSEMFGIPVSTLRYYDKQGLFPHMERTSGIRRFGDDEVEALKLIECLKRSGLEIREIHQFMEWVAEGPSTYAQRKELIERTRERVEREQESLQRALDMLKFKSWYYEQAIVDGNEDRVKAAIPDGLPPQIRAAYKNSHQG
ncbi:MAG: MerR family transcriptional regulator [Coriobacteriia bacterium]|nr:MerR family transcriptional regulator [Coriobacteriia bacterium]